MEKDRANMFEEEYAQDDDKNAQELYDDESEAEYDEEEYDEAEYVEDSSEEESEAYGRNEEEEAEEEAYEEDDYEENDENEVVFADDGIDLNELEDFAKLLGYLEQELTRYASTMVFTTKKLVDTEKCMEIITNLKEALPMTVKYCWKIFEERDNYLKKCENIANNRVDRATKDAEALVAGAKEEEENILSTAQRRSKNIIADAQARANAILKEAAAKAQRMVDESEIMKRATSEARIRVEKARMEARERRMRALQDGYRLYEALERQTIGITEAIALKKEEMRVNDQE